MSPQSPPPDNAVRVSWPVWWWTLARTLLGGKPS